MSPMSRDPSLEDFNRLAAALAAPHDDLAIYAAFEAAITAHYDHKLLTILRNLETEAERLYSSHMDIYPPGGRKAKADTVWGTLVYGEGKPLVSRHAEDIRANFPDHETIAAMGISGMINMPILWNGKVLGSVNISRNAGDFTEADVARLAPLVAMIAPVVAAGF